MCLLVICAGNSADDHIEVFCGNKIRSLLNHLLIAEMREKVRNVKYRIGFLLAYNDLVSLAVIGENNSVNCKRDRGPLIFLDAAVVMCLEVNGIVILIYRIRLKVKSGRINMGTKDVESFSGSLLADNGSCKALALDTLVNLVTGLECIFRRNVHKTQFFGRLDGISRKLALCLRIVEECLVFFGKLKGSGHVILRRCLIKVREICEKLARFDLLCLFLLGHIITSFLMNL